MDQFILLSEILIINLVLSGDNALVIAMASKDLPLKQRKQAVWWGALGAVLLRCLLTWIAVVLLQIPFIQAAGGLLLAGIAFKLLMPHQESSRVKEAGTMWRAVQTILAADFIMSLDNVLAIAALAEGDLAILVIGIAISIPIVVWGSNLIADWLQRLPVLTYAGAGILGYTAGGMFLHDPQLGIMISAILPGFANLLPVVLAVLVIMFGWINKYHLKR
ncbi:YjbE family integral membrane protein [Fontibacillus phaseoli]|uniref:YjbE family integral membrane protein n=1 Tax=Fontibacillus phaseoli TaxID=1416533 RepID=A0A369BQQ7_9BACL|nr:TerC family protein [Fontibacillus phaseoli]RCX22797.1 YjbE family integral membrane protein [Fontibacillus phaseoli]